MASTRYRLLTASLMQSLCIGHFVTIESRGDGTGTKYEYFLGRVIKYGVCNPKELTIIRYFSAPFHVVCLWFVLLVYSLLYLSSCHPVTRDP